MELQTTKKIFFFAKKRRFVDKRKVGNNIDIGL